MKISLLFLSAFLGLSLGTPSPSPPSSEISSRDYANSGGKDSGKDLHSKPWKWGPAPFDSDRQVCSADGDSTLQTWFMSLAATTATEPNGYGIISGFQDLNTIVGKTPNLLLVSDRYTMYDPAACAARCNTIAGCRAFNIYFERDTTSSYHKPSCGAACTRVRCAYYSNFFNPSDATETGQSRGHSHDIVYAGSNAYGVSGCEKKRAVSGNYARVYDGGCQR